MLKAIEVVKIAQTVAGTDERNDSLILTKGGQMILQSEWKGPTPPEAGSQAMPERDDSNWVEFRHCAQWKHVPNEPSFQARSDRGCYSAPRE